MFEISLDSNQPNAPEFKPQKRAKAKIQQLMPTVLDPSLIAPIVDCLDSKDLLTCAMLNWQWFRTCVARIYSKVIITQMSAKKLNLLLHTLSNPGLVDYSLYLHSIYISHVVYEEPSTLQIWPLVCSLLFAAPNLQTLHLGICDETMVELPQSTLFFPLESKFLNLQRLEISSSCSHLPETLINEFLRACPVERLKLILFPRCLFNMNASSWFLISERGGPSLTSLELTPALGSNMLGWDQVEFNNGLSTLANRCPNIEFLDISGHGIGLNCETLDYLQTFLPRIRKIYLPCGLDDSHLISLITGNSWKSLEVLGLACCCVDGQGTEEKSNTSCNKFSTNMIIALYDQLIENCPNTKVQVLLPRFLVHVKTGKNISILDWNPDIIHVPYKGLIHTQILQNRLVRFFTN